MTESIGAGPSRPRSPWRWAAALAATAMLAAACGGGSHPAGTGTGPGGTAQEMDSFAHCIRSHGVSNFYFSRVGSQSTPPPPVEQFGPWIAPYPSSPQFPAAQKTCWHLLGLGPPRQSPLTAAQLRSMDKAAACMRSHGFPSYPDPIVQNGSLVKVAPPSSIDINSPQFQAAQKTCRAGAP
jgi:hypothetical protein